MLTLKNKTASLISDAIEKNFAKDVLAASDIAEMLRIATTGLSNTPDLWTIMQILGEEKTVERLTSAINAL